MIERFGNALFTIALCFLAFTGGMLLAVSETPPYQFFRDAYRAGGALFEQYQTTANRFGTNLWCKARRADRGVVIHDESRAFQGYTLYTSGDGPHARLVSMDGKVVHQWQRPFSTIWDKDRAAVKH